MVTQTKVVNTCGRTITLTEIPSSDTYQWGHAIILLDEAYYISPGNESLQESMKAIIAKKRIAYSSYELAAIAFKLLYEALPPSRP